MDKQFARVIRKTEKDKPMVVVLNKIANEEPKEQIKEEAKEQE